MVIVEEIPGLIQVFSDGTVKRFNPRPKETSPATAAAAAAAVAFKFKDVVIDASKPITARIFVPSDSVEEGPAALVPVLVYFHGGGFCVGSAAWPGFHSFLGGLSVRCRCIVVSVDYRLAPEHRLPVAYYDCYASLEWLAVRHKAGGELWLQKADISRVFLSGESAGGNIVHNVALRLLTEPVGGLSVGGLLIIHPFFGGVERMEEETAEGQEDGLHLSDTYWRLSLPEGTNRDSPFCNFERAKVPDEEWRRFPRAMIFLAGKDLLKARGGAYGAFLKSKAAPDVTVAVAEEEGHAHNVFYPSSEGTKLLQRQMADFMDRSQKAIIRG